MVHLRGNWLDIARLKTAESQRGFVADNAFSLSQACYDPNCVPLGIYDDDKPVGFAMYAMDDTDKEYWIYRLMIDARYQSRGFGRAAMVLLIDMIKRDKNHHVLYVSFEPANAWAKSLYESMGFEPDDRMVDGEVVYGLEY